MLDARVAALGDRLSTLPPACQGAFFWLARHEWGDPGSLRGALDLAHAAIRDDAQVVVICAHAALRGAAGHQVDPLSMYYVREPQVTALDDGPAEAPQLQQALTFCDRALDAVAAGGELPRAVVAPLPAAAVLRPR
jgi:hypothetical protein